VETNAAETMPASENGGVPVMWPGLLWLVVVSLTSPTDSDTTQNWMASGVAVLLIAAFSPLVIFSALRFAQTQAGAVARNWTGAAVSMAPAGKVFGAARKALTPLARMAKQRFNDRITRFRSRSRSRQ